MIQIVDAMPYFGHPSVVKKMITYFELLQMIKEGRPPTNVKYRKKAYTWKHVGFHSYSYLDEANNYLSESIVGDLFDNDLASDECIEVIEELD